MFSWGLYQVRGVGERGQGLVYGKRKWPVARRGWAAARVGGAFRCLLSGRRSDAIDDGRRSSKAVGEEKALGKKR